MPSVCKLGHVQIPTVAYCLEREKASEGYKSSGPSVNSVVYCSSLVFEVVLNLREFLKGKPHYESIKCCGFAGVVGNEWKLRTCHSWGRVRVQFPRHVLEEAS